MNAHERYQDLLPLFVAGQLDETERVEMETHLANCVECQADLKVWEAVSVEIKKSNQAVEAPSAELVDVAISRVQVSSQKREQAQVPSLMRRAWQLLYAQAFLVQREMWPASAAVMTLGIIVALLSNHVEAVYFIAPLVAAASLSVLFSPEYDPAYELTLATPTSPWKVLLARLSIVSAYNLLLALIAALVLLALVPLDLLGVLILGWLAPMAFLSALALLLSLWIGTSNAVTITYILWIAQYMPYRSVGAWMVSPNWSSVILAYRQFWHSPMLLLLFAMLLIGMALWSANRPVFRLAQRAG
jgi:Putative zinc-finger